MQRLLEPLPAEALVDKEYNSMLRQVRWEAWRLAWIKTRYLRAKADWEDAEGTYLKWFEGVRIHHKQETVDALRLAIAEQILLPAPDKAALRWKKAAANKPCLPITAAEVERAIADDEAWLAAHPARRPSRVLA
jgi:hypothetical protein